MSASAPLDVNLTMLEIRHLRYEARIDKTFVGVRFHNLSGQMQRKIQSFVNQLQREARRAQWMRTDGMEVLNR